MFKSFRPVAAVMVHVADVEAGLRWYQQAFPAAIRKSIPEPFFEYLDVDGVSIEIVPADEKSRPAQQAL